MTCLCILFPGCFQLAIVVLITWNCGPDILSLTNLKQGLLGEWMTLGLGQETE